MEYYRPRGASTPSARQSHEISAERSQPHRGCAALVAPCSAAAFAATVAARSSST